jgi:hypothetical protein
VLPSIALPACQGKPQLAKVDSLVPEQRVLNSGGARAESMLATGMIINT